MSKTSEGEKPRKTEGRAEGDKEGEILIYSNREKGGKESTMEGERERLKG